MTKLNFSPAQKFIITDFAGAQPRLLSTPRWSPILEHSIHEYEPDHAHLGFVKKNESRSQTFNALERQGILTKVPVEVARRIEGNPYEKHNEFWALTRMGMEILRHMQPNGAPHPVGEGKEWLTAPNAGSQNLVEEAAATLEQAVAETTTRADTLHASDEALRQFIRDPEREDRTLTLDDLRDFRQKRLTVEYEQKIADQARTLMDRWIAGRDALRAAVIAEDAARRRYIELLPWLV